MTKHRRTRNAGKKDLVGSVAEQAGISKENAQTVVKAVLEGICDNVEKSGKLQLVGFGSFAIKKTAERQGFNPATQKPIKIPAGYKIAFKVSKTWKNSVNDRMRAHDKAVAKHHAQKGGGAAKIVAKHAVKPAAKPAAKKPIHFKGKKR